MREELNNSFRGGFILDRKSSVIIGLSIIIGFSILGGLIYFSNSENNRANELTEVTTNNINILTLEEAAEYLRISEEGLKAIVVIEANRYEQYGMKLPYFKINERYYFVKSELDLWIIEKSRLNLKYNTVNYSVTN